MGTFIVKAILLILSHMKQLPSFTTNATKLSRHLTKALDYCKSFPLSGLLFPVTLQRLRQLFPHITFGWKTMGDTLLHIRGNPNSSAWFSTASTIWLQRQLKLLAWLISLSHLHGLLHTIACAQKSLFSSHLAKQTPSILQAPARYSLPLWN